jgi:NAD(P)-dependent dehydrogenase (short-subunit alcohol dehydrogenase family)
MKLNGQVAMITGAGRNIGKAMAKLFASEGARIAVVEMYQGRGQAVVDEINKAGQGAMLVIGDVSKSADVREMIHSHRVSEPTFQAIYGRFGEKGVVELAATIGYYAMLACTLNTFDVYTATPPDDLKI